MVINCRDELNVCEKSPWRCSAVGTEIVALVGLWASSREDADENK